MINLKDKKISNIYLGNKKINKVYLGSKQVYNISKLPEEYQEVEYIESTGTQYIDTGVKLFEGLFFDITLQHISDGGMLGRFIQDGNKLICQKSGGSQIAFGYGYGIGSDYMVYRSSTKPSRVLNYKVKDYKMYIDNEFVLENPNAKIKNQDEPFYLFRQSGIYGYGRIYSAKLYNGNRIIRNFVPCYRKSDGERGLYDLVNDVFYTNAGTGTFLKGGDV